MDAVESTFANKMKYLKVEYFYEEKRLNELLLLDAQEPASVKAFL